MSFGFSPSDVLTLINLTKRTYDGWRSAGERFEDITDTLHSFKVLLVQIYNRFDALDLVGSRQGKAKNDLKDRRKDMERILHGCESAVSQLAAIARKHRKLRTWDRVRLGLKDISTPKEQLVRHIGMLTPYLLMTEMESIGQDVRLIPDSFNNIPAMIQSAVTVAFGNMLDNQADDRSSVLTTYGGEDDKRAYRELRRKLYDLGVKDSIIRNHQSELLGFMKSILSPDDSHRNPTTPGIRHIVETGVGHSSLTDTSVDPSDAQQRSETDARPHNDAEHGSSEDISSDSISVISEASHTQEDIEEEARPSSEAYQAYVESDDEIGNPSSPEQDPKQNYNHEQQEDIDPEEDPPDRLREKLSSKQTVLQTPETKHVLPGLDSSKNSGSEQLLSVDDHGIEESDKNSTLNPQRIKRDQSNHEDRIFLDSHAEMEEQTSGTDESDVESQRSFSSAGAVRNDAPWEESKHSQAKAGNVLKGQERYSLSSESGNDHCREFAIYRKRSATQGKPHEFMILTLDRHDEYPHGSVEQENKSQDAHPSIPRVQPPQANRRSSYLYSTVKPMGSRKENEDIGDYTQRSGLPRPKSKSPYQDDRSGKGQKDARTLHFSTVPQASSDIGGFSDPKNIFAEFMRTGGGQESGEEGIYGGRRPLPPSPPAPKRPPKSSYGDIKTTSSSGARTFSPLPPPTINPPSPIYGDIRNKSSNGTRTFKFTPSSQASSYYDGDPREVLAEFMRGQDRGDDQFPNSRYKPRESAVEKMIVEKPLAISLEDIFIGATKKLKVQRKTYDQQTGHCIIEDKFLSVPIKRGLKTGSKIKYPNMGDQVGDDVQDLHLITKDKPHPLFTREGNDIRCTIDISLNEAQNGWKRAVLTIDGDQLLVSSKGPTGSTWTERFPGLGMPHSKNPSERGDFIVGLRIVV